MNKKVEKENHREQAKAHRDRLDVDATDFEAIIDVFLENFIHKRHPGEGRDIQDVKSHDSGLRQNDNYKPIISAYWPMGKEFDTRFLLDELVKQGVQCAVPCVEKDNRVLTFKQWDHDTQMVQRAFGIMEPEEGEVLKPDIVIAPLLAFDQKGYRLGYGGGYYDATIETLRAQKEITFIGIGYAEQAVLFKLPREDHDIPLDYMLTPKGVIDFKGSGV